MPQPTLIIIQGAPATGKTTLRKRLEVDLKIPCLSKDDIKELLFENIDQSDREFSRLQGKASTRMLFAFAKTFLEDRQSILIENAFYADLAKSEIQKMMAETDAKCIEIFCHSDETVRKERFNARAASSDRHPGHLDTTVVQSIDPHTYSVLSVGDIITIDTTNGISDARYTQILTTVRQHLTEEGK